MILKVPAHALEVRGDTDSGGLEQFLGPDAASLQDAGRMNGTRGNHHADPRLDEAYAAGAVRHDADGASTMQ